MILHIYESDAVHSLAGVDGGLNPSGRRRTRLPLRVVRQAQIKMGSLRSLGWLDK